MRVKRVVLAMAVWAAGAGLTTGAVAQNDAAGKTRYFEVMLVMRTPAANGQEARVQSLTTDLAVMRDRPALSSGRARVESQVPVTMQTGPTYLNLGTKLDCNEARVEGGALAMAVVLEVSAVNGMVTTTDKEGRSLEEPLITKRTLQLQVRLPFGKPTVVFDAKGMEAAGGAKPLPGSVGTGEGVPADKEMRVEMTARELP